MLGNSLLTKNCHLRCIIKELGFKKVGELQRCKNYENVRFYCKTLTLYSSKPLFTYRLSNARKGFSWRYNSVKGTTQPRNENKSYFQELFHFRKMQAQRSVLVEVAKKEDVPYAVAHCKKFGSIENAYSYSGMSENCFLLLEFSREISAKEMLSDCKCDNIADAFPVCSRLVRYEKKFDPGLSEVKINEENLPVSSLKPKASVSEFLQNIYDAEKLTELETRLRFFFCALVKDSLSGLFPYCEAMPFGSSVNGLGKHGCDLDVMLRLYPEQVNDSELTFFNKTCIGNHKNFQQKSIGCLTDIFQTFFPGIASVMKIMGARVPIMKMYHRILQMNCDLSVNNMSAVYMSDVIHFCGEIDTRVRPLIFAAKKWAKEANITKSDPGPYISNFGLTNLILFFLQNRPQPILPPFNDAFVIIGEDNSFSFQVQYLKSIEELRISASLNKESLAVLLSEFLSFLATESFEDNIICLMSGKKRPRPQDKDPLCIKYPFDEGLNITKNVSFAEFGRMCEKSKISAKFLQSNLKQKVNHVTDFSILLGIPSVKEIGAHKRNQKIDIISVVEDNKFVKNKTMKHRAL